MTEKSCAHHKPSSNSDSLKVYSRLGTSRHIKYGPPVTRDISITYIHALNATRAYICMFEMKWGSNGVLDWKRDKIHN